MVEAPRVSVIVPCFNLGRYVEEAVDSVLAQTYQDFEIIVVNDGSTDEYTNAILRGLRRPRTTVLTTPNRGLPAARNHAIAHARGRYICALDADDKLHPRFLEKTLGVLDRDPTVAFVSTWVECFGAESWTWRQERCDFPKLLAECVVLTASPVRREALNAVGGYDCDRYLYGCEDWDLWISLVERGFVGTIIPEILFYYRQRPDSMRRQSESSAVRTKVWMSLLTKHRDSYQQYLKEVLLLKEQDCGHLLRANWQLQYELEREIKPRVAERVAERNSLRARLDHSTETTRLQEAIDRLLEAQAQRDRDLEAVRAEVRALRTSASWRITAPLRLAYEAWLTLRRRFTQAI